ncbi:MAG TPA: hypothetical protein VNQ79_07290 [Blastocatellia bacterium]|nr:hypothetical protein [Blastocatellia bacterium]
MLLAEWFVTIFIIYLIIGALFALIFVTVGISRLDSAARGAGFGFRLLIVPGAAALWPVLALRWMNGAPPREHNAHRDAAQEMQR